MTKPRSLLVIILILLAFTATDSLARQITFVRGYRYQATRNDTLVSCRIIALEQVKLLLLEELGTYLESNTEVGNYALTEDNITLLTAGIVKTVIMDETWDGRTYALKARLTADPDDVAGRIDALRKDRRAREELGAARKLYDAAHVALRAGAVNESEGLLKQVAAKYPRTSYAEAARDQLAQFAQIRQHDIRQLDNTAKAAIRAFRTLLEAYYADWMAVPSTLNDLKRSTGGLDGVAAAGVKIFYVKQGATERECRYALYAYHEGGQKVYIVRSDDAKISEVDRKSGILNALKTGYRVQESTDRISVLKKR
jgi:hypothetical protein